MRKTGKILWLCLAFLGFWFSGCKGLEGLKRSLEAGKHFSLAYRYLEEGKESKALSEFDKVVAATSDKPAAYLRIGLICYENKFWRGATRYLEKIVLLQPRTRLRLLLADAYDKLNRVPLAEKHYKLYIRFYPQDPFGYNNLGYFYADRNMNLDQAIRLIKEALKLQPKNGVIIDSLGWAYYRKGWLLLAQRELEKAAKREPKEPEILYHLAIVYRDVGKKAEAIKYFKKALKIDPQFKKAKRKLKDLEP